jgi:hypothetical protein
MEQLNFFEKLEEVKKPICQGCNNIFNTNRNWQKFCSRRCFYSYHDSQKQKIKINCLECGEAFETINKYKKFCSKSCCQLNNTKKIKEKKKEKKKETSSCIKENDIVLHKSNIVVFEDFDPSTFNISLGSWEHCLYCGEPPNCQDHVIPFSYYSMKKRIKAGSSEGVKVKACMECNTLLSSKYFPNIVERIDDVKSSIYRRNKKVLKNKPWDDDEIDELKYTLKTKILSAETKRREVKQRIDWITSKEGIEYLDNVKSQIKDQFEINHFLRKFFCC